MMFFLFLPKATKLGTFQGPPNIGTFHWPPSKMFPHWSLNMEHSKGHQAWNLPLATKLWSSLTSFLPLLFKGTNLDHLFLFFRTWFPIWIFENLFLQLSLGGEDKWVLINGGKKDNRLDHNSTFERMEMNKASWNLKS